MRILIAGGSGMIGRHLKRYFENKHEVIIVSRDPKKGITYDDVHRYIDENTVVINLAGKNILTRWNERTKREILLSRVMPTRKLVDEIKKSKKLPKVFIQGSAVGIYGVDFQNTYDEYSEISSSDFLSNTVKEWEKASQELSSMGIRRVVARLGVVLSRDSITFKLMVLPFKLFVGGKIGSGKQWISWIHIQDVCSIFEKFIYSESEGVYNVVSPMPVRNEELTDVLSRVLRRPKFFTVPSFALKIVFGEVADYIMTGGQRVIPRRLIEEGYEYKYPDIESAVRNLLHPYDL